MRKGLFAGAMAAILASAGIVLAGYSLLGAALAQQPVIIKFSHVVSPDAPKGKAALLLQGLVDKYTNGRAKVEIYPNSSLYKDKEELEALQLALVEARGAVHSAHGGCAEAAVLRRDVEILDRVAVEIDVFAVRRGRIDF